MLIRINEELVEEDVVGPCVDSLRIKIIYPMELAREEILRKSIHNVNVVIGEYITNLELSCKCEDEYSKLFFDSQRDKKKNEIEKYYKKMSHIMKQIERIKIVPYITTEPFILQMLSLREKEDFVIAT